MLPAILIIYHNAYLLPRHITNTFGKMAYIIVYENKCLQNVTLQPYVCLYLVHIVYFLKKNLKLHI